MCVQGTPMDHANVSKFGHKGGENCLCIFLRQYIWVRWYYSMICFRHYVPFCCQAASDLDEALPQAVVKQNSLLHIICADHLQLQQAHLRAASWTGER